MTPFLDKVSIFVRVGFDAASRLASASQGTASAAYNYVNGSAANLVQNIVFTNSGQPVMITSKSYDTLDRLTSISSTVAGATTPVSGFNYTYNAANERIRADVLSDGSHWTYGYDGLGQVTLGSRQWSDNSAVDGQQFGYSFDSIGNRISTTVNGRQSQYTSNALNQYSQRTVPGAADVIGTANAGATVTINNQKAARQSGGYFYGTATANNSQSAVDDAITVTAAQLGAGGASNALDTQQGSVFVPQTPEVFTYDADGNLTQDGHWTYTWDGENRLIGMQALSTLSATDRKKLAFSYDDTGRRVQKQVWMWNAGSNGYVASSATLFGYDSWNLVAELDGANAGALLRSNLWGCDVSGSLQGAGGVGGLLAINSNTGNTPTIYDACYDGNGNITCFVSATDGSAGAQYEYGPFAELVRTSGGLASKNPLRFSTTYFDAENGLLYYGYRYYQPSSGRWISRDPLGDPSFFSQQVYAKSARWKKRLQQESLMPAYTFVRNRSIAFVDMLGLEEGTWQFTTTQADDWYDLATPAIVAMYTPSSADKVCCSEFYIQRYVDPGYGIGFGQDGPPGDASPGPVFSTADSPGYLFGHTNIGWFTVAFKWEAICAAGKTKGKLISSITKTYTNSWGTGRIH